MYRNVPAIVIAAGLLVACSGGDTDQAGDEPREDPATEHVWQDQVDTLDKARQTQDILLDAEKARRQQLEDDG